MYKQKKVILQNENQIVEAKLNFEKCMNLKELYLPQKDLSLIKSIYTVGKIYYQSFGLLKEAQELLTRSLLGFEVNQLDIDEKTFMEYYLSNQLYLGKVKLNFIILK